MAPRDFEVVEPNAKRPRMKPAIAEGPVMMRVYPPNRYLLISKEEFERIQMNYKNEKSTQTQISYPPETRGKKPLENNLVTDVTINNVTYTILEAYDRAVFPGY